MGDDTQLPIVTSDAEALRRIDRPDPPATMLCIRRIRIDSGGSVNWFTCVLIADCDAGGAPSADSGHAAPGSER